MNDLTQQVTQEPAAPEVQPESHYTIDEANRDAKTLYKLGIRTNKATALIDQDIAELQQEMQMLQERRKEILEPLEAEMEWLKNNLMAYHQSALAKNEKEKSIKLPYATLKSRQLPQDYRKDNAVLLKWAQKNSPEFVKVADPVVAWGELKKSIIIASGKALIKETGEIIDGLEPLERVVKFDVEVL